MAQLPNCVALTVRRAPFKLPIGVRTAAVIKHSCMTDHPFLVGNTGEKYGARSQTLCGFLDPFGRQDHAGFLQQSHVFMREPCVDDAIAFTIRTRPPWCRARTVPADKN